MNNLTYDINLINFRIIIPCGFIYYVDLRPNSYAQIFISFIKLSPIFNSKLCFKVIAASLPDGSISP